MKQIIGKVMEKRGLSINSLSRETSIKPWKIQENLSKEVNKFSDKEIAKILDLSKKPSLKVQDLKSREMIIREGNKTYINTLYFIPCKSRKGFQLYSIENNKGSLRIWHQTYRTGPREFIFPNKIESNNFFFSCFGLSIGDGLNNPNLKNDHYNFSNSNFYLVKSIYTWLINYFGLNKEKIQFHLSFNKNDFNMKDEFLKEIKCLIPETESKIRIYPSQRHDKPTLTIQLSNPIFQSFYLNLFNKLKNIIITNKHYRISFLKGLFAAEGHIKHSQYETLESISFAFNPKNEKELAKFIKDCLFKEGIKSKIKSEEGHLYFCGYENMLKFFLLGITDLHKDKKEKFIRLIKNIKNYKVALYLKNRIIKKLSHFSQLELARELKISQSTISKWKKLRLIELNSFEKAYPLLNINKKELIQNINFIMISNTKIKDKKSIRFIVSLYNLKNKSYKIRLKGRRRNCTVQAKLYLILNAVVETGKKGEIISDKLINYHNYSKCGAQQWIQRLRKRGLIKTSNNPSNKLKHKHQLTYKGKKLYQKLNKLYEISDKIY